MSTDELDERTATIDIRFGAKGPPISEAEREHASGFLDLIAPVYRGLPPNTRREIVARLMWGFVEQTGPVEDAPRILGELISVAMEWRLAEPGVRQRVLEAIRAGETKKRDGAVSAPDKRDCGAL
jgi:hypothetical protein